MTKAEEWLYTEATWRRNPIAVVHNTWQAGGGARVVIIRMDANWTHGHSFQTGKILGSGRSFTMAYNDARKRGNIRRKV